MKALKQSLKDDNELKNEYQALLADLGNFNIRDTIYVVWALQNNLQFNKDIPSDIETKAEYDGNTEANLRRYYGVPEWELEEILYYSLQSNSKNILSPYSIRSLQNMGHLINRIRRISNYLESKYLSPDKKVLNELFRIAHRTFLWQEGINTYHIYRHYRIYNHPTIRKLVQEKTQLNTYDLYITGLYVLTSFLNNPFTDVNIESNIEEIPTEMIERFYNAFSIDYTKLDKLLETNPALNEKLFYRFNPLRKTPIIRIDNNYFCPLTTVLIWRITNDLYYDIVGLEGFGNAFGESFEDYIGEVLKKTLNNNFSIIPEITYSSPEKKTSDWIVQYSKENLFIECKTKRLRLGSKTELIINEDIIADTDLMASFIVQGLKSISDAVDNKIKDLCGIKKNNTFLLVLTLEEWFFYLREDADELLANRVKELLANEDIDNNIYNEIPYLIKSTSQFEQDIQIIGAFSIGEYFKKVSDNTLPEFSSDFKYTQVFEEEFDKLFFLKRKG